MEQHADHNKKDISRTNEGRMRWMPIEEHAVSYRLQATMLIMILANGRSALQYLLIDIVCHIIILEALDIVCKPRSKLSGAIFYYFRL